MRFPIWAAVAWLATCQLGQVAAAAVPHPNLPKSNGNLRIAPKFFIISMVSREDGEEELPCRARCVCPLLRILLTNTNQTVRA